MSGSAGVSPPSHAPASFACPACRAVIATVNRCPICQFTGADTLAMFRGPAPQLQPVSDAGRLWNDRDLQVIERARMRAGRRFPQFRWRICSTTLPPEGNLRLFGFWLLNVAPLARTESAADRTWTVLLVVNGVTRQATAVPGYAAEAWLTPDQWETALAGMQKPWRTGRPGQAVAAFLASACDLLETAWRGMDT
jgi:hypothetical protein